MQRKQGIDIIFYEREWIEHRKLDGILNRRNLNEIPWISAILVSINIIVFLIQTFIGDVLIQAGGLSYYYIVYEKQYYRIITCMFLHGGIDHIFSNMLILYFLGEMLEKAIGKGRYLMIYMGAGIGSGIASMGMEYLTKTPMLSIGASGAVFGVIGAMLLLVILNHGRYGSISLNRMLFAVFYMLYMGLKGQNVNNAAHVGGLLFGVLILFLIYMVNKHKKGIRE